MHFCVLLHDVYNISNVQIYTFCLFSTDIRWLDLTSASQVRVIVFPKGVDRLRRRSYMTAPLSRLNSSRLFNDTSQREVRA